jgi:tRNA dimethylallyltransferase
VALIGPTASGKSAVAMAVARAAGDIEIVSVDAFQAYRGMDIGTAKPTPAEQAEVRHHGIDLLDPGAELTMVAFRRAHDDAMVDIAARGRRPLLVGGTGLYLRAVIDRLDPPGSWPAVRAELEAVADTASLHRRLARLDPLAAGRMEPSNRRRVVRALEVCVGSGRPFSTFGPGLDSYPSSAVPQIGLRWPRPALRARIEDRFGRLVAAGFLDEVETLLATPGGLSRTAAAAIGYAELAAHLRGECTLERALDTAISRTQRFAVRQERWFRRDPRIHWVDIDDDPLTAVPAVQGAFAAWV